MNKWLSAGVLAVVFAGLVAWPVTAQQPAQEPGPQATATQAPGAPAAALPTDALAMADQLKADAFHLLREGKFQDANDKLERAAAMAQDPVLTQMAAWSNAFESQMATFAAERHKEYEKAVADTQLMIKNDQPAYALELAARAGTLADDKVAFRAEKWVDDLVAQSSRLVAQDDEAADWLKAAQLYFDLASLEPANPLWKDKLKSDNRRINLMAMYAPDELKTLRDADAKERTAAEALLLPATTQPAVAVKPAAATLPTAAASTQPDNDNFRTDWHDALKGVTLTMLSDGLKDARSNYYRETDYRSLMIGGLNGLKAVLTTAGLEKAFPGLADPARKMQFMAKLDEDLARAKDSTAANEEDVLNSLLETLPADNADTVNLPQEVLVNEFASGAFAELDPFSNMIWPADLEEFNKTTQGEFSGVGIQIQTDEDGSLRVVSPLEDSPAYKAGIKAGDVIVAIDGKQAKGISLNQAVKTITGPSGTMVTLTVRSPDGKSKDYAIKRETIKVASVKGWSRKPGGGWDYFVDDAQKIGYIRLTNFTKGSGEELDRATADMTEQGMRGMILDLRYNPGGLLNSATDVVNKFIADGVIVSTHADRHTPNPPTEARAHEEIDGVTVPLVVLVNQYSASASEIVSGALKDQQRALIVGERTFGKGSVQMLFPLDEHRAYLKLTTSHYYLPSGRCIHREENSKEWGVDPDVSVDVTPEQMRAAIDARQDMDILRDAGEAAPPSTQPSVAHKDPLTCDAQLSAALLLLRLELSGAKL